jgi:hypothetical protein
MDSGAYTYGFAATSGSLRRTLKATPESRMLSKHGHSRAVHGYRLRPLTWTLRAVPAIPGEYRTVRARLYPARGRRHVRQEYTR